MATEKQTVFATVATGLSKTIRNATSLAAWVENEGESFTVTVGTFDGIPNTLTFTHKVGYNPTFMGAQQLAETVITSISGTVKIQYFL